MCALQPNATTGATTDVATDVACDVTTDLTTAANTVRKAPRPMHQIVVSKCGDCTRAWMQGRGTLLPIDSSDVSAAECDAVTIRDRDIADAQAAGRRRPQATSTIPTKTRDLVWARDEGRCRFPGCRAMRHLALHHIVFREHGGSHDEWNLVLLCDGHHKQLHDGLVTITGRAPDDLVFVRDGRQLIDSRAPVAMASASPARPRASTTRSSRFAEVVTLAEAKQALQELGYKSRAAQRALEQVRAHVGTNADVSALVRAVLDLDRAEQAKSAVCDESVGTLATRALVQAGFSAAIAEQAVARASAHVGTETDIPTFLKEALRHCVA